MRMGLPVLLLGLLAGAPLSAASDLERVAPVRHAPTAHECGECHMAFPPALLPAGSWALIMDGLTHHFGEDALLPADIGDSIRTYLASQAGRVGDPGLVRITEQPWFVREHRYPPSVWQRPDIRSKANCPACHQRAEQGIFDDD
jgi:hypothetical protein